MPSTFAYTVLVVQRRLAHYRVPFFEALRGRLAENNCCLKLAYGKPTDEEKLKNDSADLEWAERLDTRYFLRGKVCWQPFVAQLRDADLVVMTAENKLLFNLFVQFCERRPRVVLWGHGANLQGDPRSLRETFKRHVARKADWWFAYTAMSIPLISRSGFPRSRITVLNNAVDTAELFSMRAAVSDVALAELRLKLKLEGQHIGIFVGSLYEEKRIEFMLDAAEKIREKIKTFEFLIIGDGPKKGVVARFCAVHSWARYLGACRGQEKVNLMALASVMLNPGLVGLGILDSFVCLVPIVTTDCGIHSPEIDYLKTGINGLMTADTVDAYVSGVIRVLLDPIEAANLRLGCEASAWEYTIDRMALHFTQGVLESLRSEPYR